MVLPMPWTTSVIVPALRVGVGDRERDALAALVDPEDHELAGLALAGDARGLDPEQLDVGGEEAGLEDGEHEPRKSTKRARRASAAGPAVTRTGCPAENRTGFV